MIVRKPRPCHKSLASTGSQVLLLCWAIENPAKDVKKYRGLTKGLWAFKARNFCMNHEAAIHSTQSQSKGVSYSAGEIC